ncbi:MAG: DUF2103 domain-containing protein [Cyanobacteria bacterium P01_D01_bin.1]
MRKSTASSSASKLSSDTSKIEKQADKGRVVITHSTYIPGLIPLLEKLATVPRIQTITPAVISRARSNAPALRLRVSVATMGGHKLIARKGKSAQEVFVVTELSKGELEKAIAPLLT